MPPRLSVVIPVLNEGEAVVPLLDRLFECVEPSCEVLAVFDSLDDTTRPLSKDTRRTNRVWCRC